MARCDRAEAAPAVRRAPAAGFALLEVLAAAAIFAIIMIAVYMMYETSQTMFLRGDARATAQQNARIALDDIGAAIRMAGSFNPDPLCLPAGSAEAVRIATDDTLSLHGGYRNPIQGDPAGQDCNIYVTYSLWKGDGTRDTTLHKERRRDDWGRGQLDENPLAEGVTRLAFLYFDNTGQSIPTTLPSPTAPSCPAGFPYAAPRQSNALDGQGAVASGTTPSGAVVDLRAPPTQRDLVRTVRVELTVESNIAYDAASGCFRRNVGGPTQAFNLVTEAQLRSLRP